MAAPVHRLFFALRPPPEVIDRLRPLRDRDGTGRGRVEDARLHLTTWLFDDHPVLPAGLAERAAAAASAVRPRSFRIVLDRLTGDDRGLRLVPGERVRGYEAFQRELAAALAAGGLTPRAGWRFSPHLTLRYGGKQTLDEMVDGISWIATELVLIDSILNEHRHETLARWPLPAPD